MSSRPPLAPPPVDLPFKSAVITKITLRLVPFLFLLYIVAYLDRTNVGFAVLQMEQQLGFSDKVYGNAAGVFFLGYFLFQIPSNLILERVGAKRWICLLMITWGVISSCMMFVRTAQGFYTLRFLLGLAEAGFFPGVILYLKNWFPADARARTIAWFMTAIPLAGVVGSPISGTLLDHAPPGLAGWQWMFLIEGLPAVVLGGVVLFILTDRPEGAYWLTDEQRGWLIETLEVEQRERPGEKAASVFSAVKNPNVWLLIGVYFGLNTCSYGIGLWLPKLIHGLSGISNTAIGWLVAIPYLAAAIGMVVVGHHSDHTGERRWHTALPALVAGAALIVAAYISSVGPMIVVMSVAVMAFSSFYGPFWAMPSSLLRGTAAAAGIALINSVGNLGGFFGPYIIGLVKSSTGDFKGGLLVVAGAITAAGILALLVRTGTRES
jgi:MFS transporter, ACS family, tartrate transporter